MFKPILKFHLMAQLQIGNKKLFLNWLTRVGTESQYATTLGIATPPFLIRTCIYEYARIYVQY